MFHLLGLASVLLVFHIKQTEAVCGRTPPIWRNDNMTCPQRAICADVFETVRDWYNGTRCEETRILSNCLCPGGTVCPTSDDRYRLYSSHSHKQFICRPTCLIPWCNNVQLRSRPSFSGRQTMVEPPVSIRAEQNAVEFGRKTYYQLSCRCVRHHFPRRSRGRSRSVKAFRYEYNWTLRRYATLYVCDTRGNEVNREDPCSSDDDN